MYKKNLCFICCALLCFTAISQSKLTFSLSASGALTSDATGKPYQLPLIIQFPAALSGKTIAVYDAAQKNVLALNQKKLGTDIPKSIDGNFLLTINADGTVKELDGESVNRNTFTIQVDGKFSGPFTTLAPPPPPIPPAPGPDASAYHPGYLFDDAFTIYQQVSGQSPMNPDQLQSILDHYKMTSDNYKENPFLEDILAPMYSKGLIHGGLNLTPASLIGSIGGLDVTKAADALAKFLLDRLKKELSAAFFAKFKKDMEDAKYADLRILFPNTYNTLETIDQNIYQYSIYLNTLRKSFVQDLTNGYTNLNKLLQQKKYQDYFIHKFPAAGSVLYTALYFINDFKSGQHPGDALDQFAGVLNQDMPGTYFRLCTVDSLCSNTTKSVQANLTAAFKTLQLLSFSLKSQSGSSYWVTSDSLRLLFAKDEGLKIFLGLIWQELNHPTVDKPYFDIAFDVSGKPARLVDLLQSAAPQIDSLYAYKDFIQAFIGKAEEADQALIDLKGKKKADRDYNDYYRFYNASLDLLSQASGFVDLPYLEIPDNTKNNIKNASARIFYVTRSAGELYVDVNTKNYTSAIQNAIGILDSVLNYADASTSGYATTRKAILKYGTFIAAMAEAQTSDDAEKAIESIALPAGSFSIKQKSNFNVSLNGYAGYGFDFGSYTSSGIYAPLGISFNWGLGPKKKGGAFSLFTSVFDVGSIVSYRLKDDTTSQLKQNVRLESIFSPGLHAMYEIPGVPITFSAAWRLTPKLFYSNEQDFKVVSPRSAFNFSILVDIPVITIVNKTN